MQLGHLRIDTSTRTMIVSKLQQGITSQRILDDIRNPQQLDKISREHLVSRKDITNIQRQFNIMGIQRHPNDLVSVSSWVEEMEMLEYNPILLFKQQGEEPYDSCNRLLSQDFLLVIQTKFQRDMLSAHAESGICMDATYKINDYDFNLISLLVLDNFQEGIPVLWALSNREDKSVLLHILEALNERCGTLKTNWFMSDMAQQYSSAWDEVFGGQKTKYLWCAWHVDRAWKNGLRRYVPNKAQQRILYNHLKVLMMETNTASFHMLLAQFITISKSISASFTTYFSSTYCKFLEHWASCYRLGSPMNTNMYSESFHRVLKIVYLQHKRNKRVDYLIYTLLKIARDKAFDQLQKCEKGKNTHRICEINKRHKKALTFASLAVIEETNSNLFKISSQSQAGLVYCVERKNSTCICQLKCRFCYACAHMYTCTCIDACTNTTVCKHMHLIHMQLPTNLHMCNPQSNFTTQNDLDYYKKISLPSQLTKITTQRQNIQQKASDIWQLSNVCEESNTLDKVHHYLESALAELKKENIKIKRKPSHENSKIQRRYYSTTKKRKLMTETLNKPSIEEAQLSQQELQMTETEVCSICFSEEDKGVGNVEWVSCSKCLLWVHSACADFPSNSSQEYICQYCCDTTQF